MTQRFTEAVELLTQLGAEVVEVKLPELFRLSWYAHGVLFATELMTRESPFKSDAPQKRQPTGRTLFMPDAVARPLDRGYVQAIVPLIHERLKLLSEGPELVDLFFIDTTPDQAALLGKQLTLETARPALAAATDALAAHADWTRPALEALLRPMTEALGLKTGVFFGLLRVAVTGRPVSPPLFESLALLGRESALARIRSHWLNNRRLGWDSRAPGHIGWHANGP